MVNRARLWSFALALFVPGLASSGCQEPAGLMRAQPAETTVKFDFDHRPLPDIPLPNDIATRPDHTSRTGKRINASMIAPTGIEARVRRLIDGLDGWGVYQPITIPFTKPIDVYSVLARHRFDDYDTENDAIYLVNIDRESREFGRVHHLDVGHGNYPVVLERLDRYGDNDPRGWTLSLPFEEADEDLNGNGVLDPGEDTNHNGVLDPGEDRNGNGVLDLPEDTDADGTLDKPNYLPGRTPGRDDLIGRADALMTFYERETNTLMVAPMEPLQPKTRYAVIVTRRIRDENGDRIGSPFAWVNHTAQTEDLEPLMEVLPKGLEEDEIAFAFSYTTESTIDDWIRVREGLYGLGIQGHLGEEYPAEITTLAKLKKTGPGETFEGKTPYVVNHEILEAPLTLAATQLQGLQPNSEQGKALLTSQKYVDFHVMGTYTSPQLFDRFDEDGNDLPLDLQSWPNDLDHNPVEHRAEEIPWWAVVPRKEVSARGEGKQVPVVLLGHGYTSTRVGELIGFAGFLNEFGVAVLGTDNVSHGLGLGADDKDLLVNLFDANGLIADPLIFARGGMVDDDGDGVPDRHYQDRDRDGVLDSGADFWTSYLFHTRDMMRQSALDYMQLIRIIRTWDGVKTWPYDTNNDGIIGNDLAGDFDGDGMVDIGSESPIYVMGGSLGGIMSTALGGVEPEVDAIIPIAGGGRLTDVGNRSLQGGVPQAVIMRVLGPTYLVTVGDDGSTSITTQVTELNNLSTFPIRQVTPGAGPSLLPGDTFLARNLDNDEVACAYLLPDTDDNGVAARARVNLPSDAGDRTVLEIYRGPVLVNGSDACELIDEPGKPLMVIDSMPTPLDDEGNPMTYEGVPIEAGELRSLVEGYGLRRGNPEIRRFMSLAQMVLDPTDPGVLSRHLAAEPFEYPLKGDKTGARFLIVTTVGDMNVPASSGVTVARAAGVIDYLNPNTPWGKSVNQVLLDTYTTEAVNVLGRKTYGDPPDNENVRSLLGLDGTLGVHVDVENFSLGQDIWGNSIERLDPGLNLLMTRDVYGNDLGGYSGAIFTYSIPKGQHGFAFPGEMTDWAIGICKETYGSTDDRCDPENVVGQTFDVGWAMFHLFGAFVTKGDTENPLQYGCWSLEACNDLPEVPPARPLETLP